MNYTIVGDPVALKLKFKDNGPEWHQWTILRASRPEVFNGSVVAAQIYMTCTGQRIYAGLCGNGDCENNYGQYISDSTSSYELYEFALEWIYETEIPANISISGDLSNGAEFEGLSCVGLNCSATMQFYAAPGYWNLSALYMDKYGNQDLSLENAVTYAVLISTSKSDDKLSYSSPIIGNNNVSADVPITIRNAGNVEYDEILLTAYDLTGVVVPTKVLNVSYFRAGVSLGNSVQLENAVQKSVPFTLTRGADVSLGFNLWLSAPSTLYPQSYISLTPWDLTLSPIS
jgi:hypothetical protein